MTPTPVTLNDLEGHSSVARFFKGNFSTISTAFYKISNKTTIDVRHTVPYGKGCYYAPEFEAFFHFAYAPKCGSVGNRGLAKLYKAPEFGGIIAMQSHALDFARLTRLPSV